MTLKPLKKSCFHDIDSKLTPLNRYSNRKETYLVYISLQCKSSFQLKCSYVSRRCNSPNLKENQVTESKKKLSRKKKKKKLKQLNLFHLFKGFCCEPAKNLYLMSHNIFSLKKNKSSLKVTGALVLSSVEWGEWSVGQWWKHTPVDAAPPGRI